MSLVNDALKRAKQAQPPPPLPASSGPQLRPVEPLQQCVRGAGLALPAVFAVVALLALLFVGWAFHQGGSAKPAQRPAPPQPVAQPMPPPMPVASSAPATPVTPAEIATPNSPLPAKPAPAPQRPAPVPEPGPIATTAATKPGAPASTNLAPSSTPAAGVTNTPAITEAAPPKPPPLRLQAIVFHPTRPSAMISGKTVFLGDRLGEFRVAAIAPDGATLIGAGRTNVLSLPQ